MARKKLRVTQTRDGKRVTFLTPDKGKPGKTPKAEQWYEPGIETGWKKDMPEGERRRLVLQAHKGDELSSARSMQAKANVTTDTETKRKAKADAQYFFRRHRIGKKPVALKARRELPISQVRTDLVDELTRRMKAQERLPVGVTGPKSIQKYIDSMSDSNARDWHSVVIKAPAPRIRKKGKVTNLQHVHARRSTRARIRDEQQSHQVTIEVDSPRVKVWLKDPSAADIKDIDTPSVGRRRTPRITPPTPKLRR